MIKKGVIFLALLGGGFFTLYSLVETKAKNRPDNGDSQGARRPRDPGRDAGPPIVLPTDDGGPAVEWKPTGAWTIPRYRTLVLPDGRVLQILAYVLHAEDRHAEADNKLMLERVTIEFFKIDATNRNQPLKSGTLRAAKARIELSQDQDKVAKIAEDKLMEFWDLVYTAESDTALSNIQISLPHALVRNDEDSMHLWTPEKDARVQIVDRGLNGFTIVGEGLDAWIPTTRDEQGEVKMTSSGLRRVQVHANPVLTHKDTVLRSSGPLFIREDAKTGTSIVTMTDTVRVTTRQTGVDRTGRPREVVATGDSLEAIMVRSTINGRETTTWNRIVLRGTPAKLTNGRGNDLECAKLTVTPDSAGEPYWFTAEGTGEFAPVMRQLVGDRTTTFRSSGRVHVIEIRKQHGFFLTAYGVAPGAIPPEFDQVIIFEGQTTVLSPKDHLELVASDGITVIRSEQAELRDFLILRGRGDIRVKSDQILATGNRGFTLRQLPIRSGSSGIDLRREFQLGPTQVDSGHHYEVLRLAQKGEPLRDGKRRQFRLVGSGACAIRMLNRVVQEIHLRSPAEDIDVTMSGTNNRLWQLKTLDAWLGEDGTPRSFIGKGRTCLMSFTTKDGTVHGRAEEVHQPRADTYRFVSSSSGSLAEVRHEKHGKLRGREILVQQLSELDVRLRATGDAELEMVETKDGQHTKVHLRADEIRAEPFFAPPFAAQLHDDLLPKHLSLGMRSRYLFATGNVDLKYEIGQGNRIHRGSCTGSKLVLQTDREGQIFADGKLVGTPATFESTDPRGRITKAECHLVTFHNADNAQYLTLHPVNGHLPKLSLLGSTNGTVGPMDRFTITCDGRVEVVPRQILCLGPVEIRSIDALGNIDPEGYALDARSMVMDRTPTGEIIHVEATGDVAFRWTDAVGKCDKLSIDLPRNLLKVHGIAKPITVRLGDYRMTVTHLEYDYRTKMHKSWNGQLQRVLTHK